MSGSSQPISVTLAGWGGNDTLVATGGYTTITGGPGDDDLTSGPGTSGYSKYLYSQAGNIMGYYHNPQPPLSSGCDTVYSS